MLYGVPHARWISQKKEKRLPFVKVQETKPAIPCADPIMDSARIPSGPLRSDARLTTTSEGRKTWQVDLWPLCEIRRSHRGHNKPYKDTLRASKTFVISGVLDSLSSSTKRASSGDDRGEKPEPKAVKFLLFSMNETYMVVLVFFDNIG